MKILTLLFLSFSGLITHTSFACSKELLQSPDYSQELSKEIAKAPVFYIEKNTFNELLHDLTNASLWSYILLGCVEFLA